MIRFTFSINHLQFHGFSTEILLQKSLSTADKNRLKIYIFSYICQVNIENSINLETKMYLMLK